MFANKPIIGIAGGIGSGKSMVADLFGELDCWVVHSDKLVHEAYHQDDVKAKLREWWGDAVFCANGRVDTAAVGRKVFADPEERRRLEQYLHPLVNAIRDVRMKQSANDAQVKAFVWDTPLLFETGLNSQCDAVVFIAVPFETRLVRVSQSRGWGRAELAQRENLQMPLDKKREISDYVLENTADAENARGQVREILSRILARSVQRASPDSSSGA